MARRHRVYLAVEASMVTPHKPTIATKKKKKTIRVRQAPAVLPLPVSAMSTSSFSLARLERVWTLSGPVLLAEEPLHFSATTEKPKHPMRAPMRMGQRELPAGSASAVKISACGKAGAGDSPPGTLRRGARSDRSEWLGRARRVGHGKGQEER